MATASLISIFLALTLIGSWAFFAFFLARSRQRFFLAIKKLEDIRHQLREEINGAALVMELFNTIHEDVLQHEGAGAKSELARKIVDVACKVSRCPNASLMLIDPQTGDLVLAAGKGYPDHSFATRLKMGEGVLGLAAESGRTLIVDNVDTDVRFIRKEGVDDRLKSMIALPLKIKNRVLGVLSVSVEEPHHSFDERSARLLGVLAEQGAITVDNLDAYENLQSFYLEMVETLARALEFKENVQENRSDFEQIRGYARSVARQLNLPDSIARNVEFASIINGIGKIAINDSILRKPGKLTAEEYDQIKRHPEIAQKIISKVKFLSPVTPMVLYHQERWDGKGYPAGLKGEEIPLGSRIVAVLNAYHAMTSNRPYRKALSQEEAVAELQRGASSQFDPKVIEAFVQVLKRDPSSLAEEPGSPDSGTR